MAESVFLDLVTPPGSPQQEGPVQPLAEEKREEPVQQVAEGGPGRLTICVQHVQAMDWAEHATFADAAYWIKQVFLAHGSEEVDTSKYQLTFRDWNTSSGFSNLFVKMSGDVRIFSLLAHSAPYPPAEKPLRKNDPMQLMSFGEGDKLFVPFLTVASAIRDLTVRKANKYHFLLLGCCQGDKLVPLLKGVTTTDGVLVYFGADEDDQDGAAEGLIAEFWEKLLENVKDRVDQGLPLDCKEVFEISFVEAGQLYLAPTGQEDEREPNGDFKYLRLFMDKSVKNAEKDPAFVKDYTFAGDLHALMGGLELVTPELKARRERFFAEKQREVDQAQEEGARAVGTSSRDGKRRRS